MSKEQPNIEDEFQLSGVCEDPWCGQQIEKLQKRIDALNETINAYETVLAIVNKEKLLDENLELRKKNLELEKHGVTWSQYHRDIMDSMDGMRKNTIQDCKRIAMEFTGQNLITELDKLQKADEEFIKSRSEEE